MPHIGMPPLRRLAITLAPPLLYIALVYEGTRPPKPVYKADQPTTMTVSDKGGPAALHAPPVVYPRQALRAGVEGSVTLKITVAADGTVARAVPVAGPFPLRRAAVENVLQWQFEAKAQKTQVEVGFSSRYATHSLVLPEPVRRFAAVNKQGLRGRVRVVAMVDPEGSVEFVQAVTGPEKLVPAALDSVRHWKFRPMLRDGRPEHGTAVVDVPFGL